MTEIKEATLKSARAPSSRELKELGFDWLAKSVDEKRRTAIAYEHYKRVSYRSDNFAWCHFDRMFIAEWGDEIPPRQVLDALRQAKKRQCFKGFVIWFKGKDPLLMGTIQKECGSAPFIIAHWGDIDLDWLEKNTE